MHPTPYNPSPGHDHLDEVMSEIAQVGERERALTADLTRERAHLEDLLELRFCLLTDELQARVEQAPPPAMLAPSNGLDRRILLLALFTSIAIWVVAGAAAYRLLVG